MFYVERHRNFHIRFNILIPYVRINNKARQVNTQFANETFNFLPRTHAAFIVGTATWLFGFITIGAFDGWAKYRFFGISLFEGIDNLTSNIMLPLGGLGIAIFTGWRMKKALLVDELNIGERFLFRGWLFCIQYIVPIAIIIILLDVSGIF